MNDYRLAEQTILDEMTEAILDSHDQAYLYDLEDKWGEYATALALHRLANAWERRVQLAEATARQKGIDL